MVSAGPAINVGQINSNIRNLSRAWRTDAGGLGLMYVPLTGTLLSKRIRSSRVQGFSKDLRNALLKNPKMPTTFHSTFSARMLKTVGIGVHRWTADCPSSRVQQVEVAGSRPVCHILPRLDQKPCEHTVSLSAKKKRNVEFHIISYFLFYHWQTHEIKAFFFVFLLLHFTKLDSTRQIFALPPSKQLLWPCYK